MLVRSNILLRRLPVLLLSGSFALGACQEKEANCEPQCDGKCGTVATVRNLTGLDGCGKVLELADGKRLEPSGPLWTAFASADGQKVVVNYKLTGAMSVCMVGEGAEVTCIRAADAVSK